MLLIQKELQLSMAAYSMARSKAINVLVEAGANIEAQTSRAQHLFILLPAGSSSMTWRPS